MKKEKQAKILAEIVLGKEYTPPPGDIYCSLCGNLVRPKVKVSSRRYAIHGGEPKTTLEAKYKCSKFPHSLNLIVTYWSEFDGRENQTKWEVKRNLDF